MKRTGIPVNFGITVSLGFVIGAAIAGQTFLPVHPRQPQAVRALKAMGVSNARIVGMVLVQALVVGVMGYAFGLGLAAMAEELIVARVKGVPPAVYMAWPIPLGMAVAAGLIVMASAPVSLPRADTGTGVGVPFSPFSREPREAREESALAGLAAKRSASGGTP